MFDPPEINVIGAKSDTLDTQCVRILATATDQ